MLIRIVERILTHSTERHAPQDWNPLADYCIDGRLSRIEVVQLCTDRCLPQKAFVGPEVEFLRFFSW